jgi:ferric-dicitrate binding protein FerR (iron transport regulator)
VAALESALESGKYPSVPIVTSPRRWWLRGFAFATAALALGFVAYRMVPPLRSASPLHYVLEGGTLGPGETIKAAPEVPAKLVFSDASQVRLAPRAKLSVLSLDARGSRIALADGELDVQVQHRPGSSWSFEAGPFTVKVKGTAFHLAYESDRGRLALQMVTGVVEVRGPSHDRVLTLRAGESLELFAGRCSQGGPPPTSKPALAPKPVEVAPPARVRSAARFDAFSSTASTSAGSGRYNDFALMRMAWDQLIAQGDFSCVVKTPNSGGWM